MFCWRCTWSEFAQQIKELVTGLQGFERPSSQETALEVRQLHGGDALGRTASITDLQLTFSAKSNFTRLL